MGNNLTALTQFYSPPNPPTPLSPDKYFWIESGGGGGAADDDEERARPQCDGETALTGETTTTASSCQSPGGLRTAIPVVYISRGGRDGGGSGPAGAGPAAGGVDESQADGGRFTLLYCHGHDVDLGLIYDFLVHLSKLLGVDILSFDYAGYGLSKIGRRRRRRGNGIPNSPPERGEAGQEVLLAASDARDPRRAEGGDPSGNDDDEGRRRRPEDDPEGEEEEEEFSAADAAINASPPTEEQCYADVLACYEFLVRERNVPPKNIVLYGKSLGSGPACWLARRLCEEAAEGNGNGGGGGGAAAAVDGDREASASIDATRRRKPSSSSRGFSPVPKAFRKSRTPPMPLGGVVLHSAFLSILRLRIHVGFTLSSTDAFDNDATLRGVLDCTTTENLPIYFIHGREDEVVPFQHGEGLCEIMIGKRKKGFPPFWADGGTHWNIEHKYATAYIKRLQQFLRHCAKMNGVPVKKRNSKGKKGARDASRGRGAAAASNTSPNAAAREGAEREGRRAADPADDPETGSRASSRGRGRISRPSFTMMSARARSNSKAARQRKKKGTLVMRGEVEEDGDGGAAAAAGAPYGATPAIGTSGGKKKKKGGHRRGGGGEGSSGKGTRGAKGGGGGQNGSLYASKLKAMVALESRDPPSMDRYI